MGQLWFGLDGVRLSQHTDNDSDFPGWQKELGEGTHQADYTSDGVFPNDDASHIEVGEGYSAEVIQNSYSQGNQGPDDKEETFKGPTSANLTDFDLNDEASEIIVSRLTPPPPPPPPPSPPSDDVIDTNVDDKTIPSLETSSLVAEDSNMVMYVSIGAVVLVAAYLLITRKPAKR